MSEEQKSRLQPLSIREAPLRIRDFSAFSQNLELKTPYQLVHEMDFAEYTNYCDKLLEAGNDREISNSSLINKLSSWHPRFDGEFLIPTLRTMRNIDPYRAERFDREKKNLKYARLQTSQLRNFKVNWINNYADELIDTYRAAENEDIKMEIGGIFLTQLSHFRDHSFTPSQVRPAIEFFIENFDTFKNTLLPSVMGIFFKKGMIASNKTEDEISVHRTDISRDVLDLAIKILEDPDSSSIFKNAAIKGLAVAQRDSDNVDIRLFADSYLAYKVKKFGVDPDQILFVWSQNLNNPEKVHIYPEYIASNFDLMERLEVEREGICKALFDEFGIHNFARYSLKALIEQYDTRDHDIPYGVYIGSHNDHNGAYSDEPRMLDNLFMDLSHLGYMLRIYEAGSGFEVIDTFENAHKKYGSKNKISFAIIAGHGNPNEIEMGNSIVINENGMPSVRRHYFSKNHIKREATVEQLKKWFIKKPNIVLDSCSTGEKAGIGNEIHKIGADVFAPKKNTGVKGYAVGKRSNGTLWFVVDYIEKDAIAHYRQNQFKN